MPAASYDFLIEQASDFNINFQYLDQNGFAIDLSNACVSFRLLDNFGSGYRYSCEACGCSDSSSSISPYKLIVNQTGLISLFLPDTTTANFNFDTAQYDLDARTPNNGNYRIATGTITLIKKVIPNIFTCAGIVSPGGGGGSGDEGSGGSGGTGSNASSNASQDLCFPDCLQIDSYSIIYNSSSGLPILDNTNNSGIINLYDPRNIEGVDVVINGLTHQSPQDLTFILSPPSGDSVLLSSNSKIQNYKSNFGFVFTDKYSNFSINNVPNGGYANIKDKTDIVKYNDLNLQSNFNHLYGYSMPSGDWTLFINDNDVGGTGLLSSWQLIVTYEPTA